MFGAEVSTGGPKNFVRGFVVSDGGALVFVGGALVEARGLGRGTRELAWTREGSGLSGREIKLSEIFSSGQPSAIANYCRRIREHITHISLIVKRSTTHRLVGSNRGRESDASWPLK